MLLSIDIGNSNIEICVHQTPLKTARFETDRKRSSDEYYQRLKPYLEGVDAVVISCVVPSLVPVFSTLFNHYLNIDPLYVGPGVKTGIKLPTENPKEVGADLVSVAAGVCDKYGADAIIIDMGTATTVSLVKKAALEGVSIMIGLDSAKEALIDKASLLPDFVYQIPARPIGDTTLTALNAGFLYGHMYQIQGFVAALKEPGMVVVMTGGAARILEPLFPKDYIYDPNIIHHGLKVIASKNASR